MDHASRKSPLIVILGPTSSGKTALSLALARDFRGEIVSADSRQVYRGLNIGTNKVTREEQVLIPHHLIDIAEPSTQLSVAEYKQYADTVIESIISRSAVPFLVGGSPLYVYSVADNYTIPAIAPDLVYRAELEAMSDEERLTLLASVDPATHAVIDQKNPRRVIRALEVVRATGQSFVSQKRRGASCYDALFLGITRSREELYTRIDQSVDMRIKGGLIEEVQGLLDACIPAERLMRFGLEYRFVTRYLLGELSLDEAVQQLKYATHDFARRQLTWFGKDARVHWISSEMEAHDLVSRHLAG